MRSFLSCAAPPVLGFAWAIAYPFMPGIVRVHACGFASSNNATHHTCEHCKSVTLQGCRRLLQGSTLLLCGLGPALACDKGLYKWWAWCRGVWVRVFFCHSMAAASVCVGSQACLGALSTAAVWDTLCAVGVCVWLGRSQHHWLQPAGTAAHAVCCNACCCGLRV